MQKIIAALIAAIAFVFATRETIVALKKQIADRDQIITDLHTAIDANRANDAALEQAVLDAKDAQKVAEEALAVLNAEIALGNAKAEELAASITADPAIPVTVDPDTGEVTPVDPVV